MFCVFSQAMVFPDEIEDKVARPQSPLLEPPRDANEGGAGAPELQVQLDAAGEEYEPVLARHDPPGARMEREGFACWQPHAVNCSGQASGCEARGRAGEDTRGEGAEARGEGHAEGCARCGACRPRRRGRGRGKAP